MEVHVASVMRTSQHKHKYNLITSLPEYRPSDRRERLGRDMTAKRKCEVIQIHNGPEFCSESEGKWRAYSGRSSEGRTTAGWLVWSEKSADTEISWEIDEHDISMYVESEIDANKVSRRNWLNNNCNGLTWLNSSIQTENGGLTYALKNYSQSTLPLPWLVNTSRAAQQQREREKAQPLIFLSLN